MPSRADSPVSELPQALSLITSDLIPRPGRAEHRTDISSTVFLAEPDEYDGGEF